MNEKETEIIEQLRSESLEKPELDQKRLLESLGKTVRNRLSPGKTLIVAIVGGEASGKSTLTDRLVKYLASGGIAAGQISTDNYAVGDRAFRRKSLEGDDPRKKHDFESLRKHVEQIKKLGLEETIKLPTYDEQSGLALSAPAADWKRKVSRLDVLIVEGVFYQVQADLLFFLWLDEALRLEKRISRDQKQREKEMLRQLLRTFSLGRKANISPTPSRP